MICKEFEFQEYSSYAFYFPTSYNNFGLLEETADVVTDQESYEQYMDDDELDEDRIVNSGEEMVLLDMEFAVDEMFYYQMKCDESVQYEIVITKQAPVHLSYPKIITT